MNENLILHIEDYLNGTLDKNLVAQIEEAIKNDQQFAREVAFRKKVMQAVTDHELPAFKKLLAQTENKIIQENNGKIRRLRPKHWVGMAASILLIIISFFYLNHSTSSPQQLYETYSADHQSIQLNLTTRSDDSLAAQRQAIEIAFNSRKYAATIPLIENYLSIQPDINYNLVLVLGICYLETNQYELALENFKAVEKYSLNEEQGKWYQALTYLKKEDINSAINVLNKIVTNKTSSLIGTQAQALLEDIQ